MGTEAGRVALDSTGAGALVGVPANAPDAAFATDGVTGAYRRASNNLAKDTMSLCLLEEVNLQVEHLDSL